MKELSLNHSAWILAVALTACGNDSGNTATDTAYVVVGVRGLISFL